MQWTYQPRRPSRTTTEAAIFQESVALARSCCFHKCISFADVSATMEHKGTVLECSSVASGRTGDLPVSFFFFFSFSCFLSSTASGMLGRTVGHWGERAPRCLIQLRTVLCVPASGRPGFQTDACARTLTPPPLPFCTCTRSRWDTPRPLTVPLGFSCELSPTRGGQGYCANPFLLWFPLRSCTRF